MHVIMYTKYCLYDIGNRAMGLRTWISSLKFLSETLPIFFPLAERAWLNNLLSPHRNKGKGLLTIWVRTLSNSFRPQASMAQVAQLHLQMTEENSSRRWPFQPDPFSWVSHDNCWLRTENTRISVNFLHALAHFVLRIISQGNSHRINFQ